jgi:hypothetical protein
MSMIFKMVIHFRYTTNRLKQTHNCNKAKFSWPHTPRKRDCPNQGITNLFLMLWKMEVFHYTFQRNRFPTLLTPLLKAQIKDTNLVFKNILLRHTYHYLSTITRNLRLLSWKYQGNLRSIRQRRYFHCKRTKMCSTASKNLSSKRLSVPKYRQVDSRSHYQFLMATKRQVVRGHKVLLESWVLRHYSLHVYRRNTSRTSRCWKITSIHTVLTASLNSRSYSSSLLENSWLPGLTCIRVSAQSRQTVKCSTTQ